MRSKSNLFIFMQVH